MLLFECTLEGGGKGDFVLTVTCASQFAGTTITCTDGITTLTKNCPSTSPYTIEFAIPNGGTWTVSGVYGGATISESVTIEDSVMLTATPEGSTVLPTDDIQTWLHCANIWDKAYTTISEVLNDASTLQALIASNNAADYMSRSTTWASSVCEDSSAMTYIGANDYCAEALLADSTWLAAICNSTYFESVLPNKVPTMTSNTTPSGTCSADSVYNNDTTYAAYKAFDNSSSTFWHSASHTVPFWVRYDFANNQKVSPCKVKLQNRSDVEQHIVKTFKIQGSDDGNTWTDITDTITSTAQTQSGTSQYALSRLTTTKFNKIRMQILTSTSGSIVCVASLQFWSR